MREIAGKRALVTGVASGIGREITLRLAAEGVDLYLLDIDQVGLKRTADEAFAAGADVVARHCDIADGESLNHAVDEALERWVGVDILVNNAGITYHGSTHEMSDEHWDRLMAVNLHAPVQLTRALLPTLLARPEGHVLNICSFLGLVGLPKVNAYCTAKFGLVGFGESLRSEYGRVGLGVTSVCPGLVRTNLFTNAELSPGAKDNKVPPAFICTTPERVAKASVRAIQRNRAVVHLEPFSRALYTAKQSVPSLLDWLLRLGERRRVANKRRRLEELGDDPTEALRRLVYQDRQELDSRRQAA